MPKSKDGKAVAIAAAVKSKAAEKLADAVSDLVDLSHNVVDYITGPKRIASVNAARNEAAVEAARGKLPRLKPKKRSCVRRPLLGFWIGNLARHLTGVLLLLKAIKRYHRPMPLCPMCLQTRNSSLIFWTNSILSEIRRFTR